jgi:hypothetical protein
MRLMVGFLELKLPTVDIVDVVEIIRVYSERFGRMDERL